MSESSREDGTDQEQTSSKTSLKAFAGKVMMVNGVLIALGGLPMYDKLGNDGMIAGGLAMVLTTLNAIVGYYYIDRYFNADFRDFMYKVFGSMGLRLLVLGGIIFNVIHFTEIHRNGFIISLFISYICQSVTEVIFINKKASNGKQN